MLFSLPGRAPLFGVRVACEIDMGSRLRSGWSQVAGHPGSASFAHQLRKPLKWGRRLRWEGLQECFLMNLADLGRHFLQHIERWLWAKSAGCKRAHRCCADASGARREALGHRTNSSRLVETPSSHLLHHSPAVITSHTHRADDSPRPGHTPARLQPSASSDEKPFSGKVHFLMHLNDPENAESRCRHC